ncbi:MAG: riboflavin biosynthesis protein RibF [Spirochaetes bacterium]|nr:riboflavin biosynthesis protein RibF [Spirochaetota bacterium]
MRIVDFELLKNSRYRINTGAAVTIGGFDGLHRGHNKLIHAVTGCSGLIPVVVTFKQSPASVIRKDSFKGNILTFQQKAGKLELMGIDTIVLIDFSPEFSTLTGKQFLHILMDALDIKKIVVGFNFHLGYRQGMDARELKNYVAEYGIVTEIILPVLYKNEAISSSRIRSSIRKGDFVSVAKMLGYGYIVEIPENIPLCGGAGKVEIEKESIPQLLPDSGLFGVIVNGNSERYRSVVEIDNQRIIITGKKNTRVKTLLFLKQNKIRRFF